MTDLVKEINENQEILEENRKILQEMKDLIVTMNKTCRDLNDNYVKGYRALVWEMRETRAVMEGRPTGRSIAAAKRRKEDSETCKDIPETIEMLEKHIQEKIEKGEG